MTVRPRRVRNRIAAAVADAEEVNSQRDPLEGLVERTRAEPGTPFLPAMLCRLAELRRENRPAYETLRSRLRAAGARVAELDRALSQQSGESGGREPTHAEVLIEIGQSASLFHTPDHTAYADILVGGHRETWPLRARGFRRWLLGTFFQETNRSPNNEALQSALGVLEAEAHYNGPERPVYVRVGQLGERIYLDMADANWRAIEIDANGWRIVDEPPVRFRRSEGMLSLPEPQAGGSTRALRRLLNVQSESEFVLVLAWLVGALRGQGPYPVLVVTGEQGSAKSTCMALLRALIDPNAAGLRALPREDRDLFIAAQNGHILAFDNISGLANWVSDTLCRLATGGGFAVRRLYSDAEETLFEACRPVILNGIEDIIARPDLADRALFLTLSAIPEEQRRPEREIWAQFERYRPRILGALLDAVSHGLAHLPTTHLPRLPRMADFALWATACEGRFGQAEAFWSAYEGNRSDAIAGVIEADPVAAAVRGLMAMRTVWTGTAADLLAALGSRVDERTSRSRTWPDGPRAMAGRIRRAATALRTAGLDVTFEREGDRDRTRVIRIERIEQGEPESEGRESSEPSASSTGTGSLTEHTNRRRRRVPVSPPVPEPQPADLVRSRPDRRRGPRNRRET